MTSLVGLWLVGLVLLGLGVIIAVVQRPTTGLDLLGELEQSGSEAGFLLGLGLAGVGQAVLMVAVIATGVRVGMKVDRLNR